MSRITKILICFLILVSCENEQINNVSPQTGNGEFLSAVDLSRFPEISNTSPTFFDLEGNEKEFLTILKENGVNTVRLRLWVNPVDEHSGFNEVKAFSQTLRNRGFKVWLTLHYSDTWADPGQQETPLQWQGLDFESLKETVYNYTAQVINEIEPDYIQIGNEINSGMLHPYGNITTNYQNFLNLLQEASNAVRDNSEDCKIILHFAGIQNSDWFFNQVSTIDYDIIGVSYYPIWHGMSLNNLKNAMQSLSEANDKQIIIAETAYPFTLEWNDWTNNIVGLEEQLILPEYPATELGQSKFVRAIKTITQELEKGIGFCYWGAELIAWNGNQATNASPWENQALFDFSNKALPALEEFKIE
ncbi:MAG: arabinogalactan endo-1,4-beta-galactosidase [Winogradskyella sp.]|uniref:glycoside hydrolase family 53 protein n=1 Tax=Winogradskyella sp. TaxID=1883156 RepID=UPI000F402B42|nr:glycosyl hydrolase 53 family protein [Winogradskyella sp.]RNC80202.1 MAG: arabinogalactan endo-1,4-beta-galactosidase [Winogradskyella sp.]